MKIDGRCHCGNLSFSLDWQPESAEIQARACDCSFCTRHGNVWTSCPDGQLNIRIQNEALVSRYCFATETAEFLVCARCGCIPAAVSRIGEREYAVVNVKLFEPAAPVPIQVSQARLGAETEAERLRRRQCKGIGKVQYLPVP